MNKAKFLFGDIVVINGIQVGVVVRTWETSTGCFRYEIYNRLTIQIEEYYEEEVDRYRVRHKYLNEEELDYQNS